MAPTSKQHTFPPAAPFPNPSSHKTGTGMEGVTDRRYKSTPSTAAIPNKPLTSGHDKRRKRERGLRFGQVSRHFNAAQQPHARLPRIASFRAYIT